MGGWSWNRPPFGSPWPALLFDFFQIFQRLTSKSPHAWWITPLTSPQPQQTAERCIAEGFLWAPKEAPQLSQVPRGDLDLLTLWSGGFTHPKVYPPVYPNVWSSCHLAILAGSSVTISSNSSIVSSNFKHSFQQPFPCSILLFKPVLMGPNGPWPSPVCWVQPWKLSVTWASSAQNSRIPMAERLLTHDFHQVIRYNQVGGLKKKVNSSLSSRQREIINHPLVSTVRSIQLYN